MLSSCCCMASVLCSALTYIQRPRSVMLQTATLSRPAAHSWCTAVDLELVKLLPHLQLFLISLFACSRSLLHAMHYVRTYFRVRAAI